MILIYKIIAVVVKWEINEIVIVNSNDSYRFVNIYIYIYVLKPCHRRLTDQTNRRNLKRERRPGPKKREEN